MELSVILSYQETDIKLRKLLDSIEKNDDNKRMEQAKQEFNVARQRLMDCEKEAGALTEFYDDATTQFNDGFKKIKELELAAEATDDESEIAKLIEQIDALRQKISDLDRKLSDRKQKAEKVMRDYKDASDRGRKMREIHNAAKERMEVLKSQREPEVLALKKSLKEISAKIDKDLFETYKSITHEGKYPAFVEAYDDGSTFSCRGCGLALSQKNKSALLENGSCRCETCRRLIYRK